MENQIFKIGEIVVLKSDGEKMTVVESTEKETKIIYFNATEGKLCEHIMPTETLKTTENKPYTMKVR